MLPARHCPIGVPCTCQGAGGAHRHRYAESDCAIGDQRLPGVAKIAATPTRTGGWTRLRQPTRLTSRRAKGWDIRRMGRRPPSARALKDINGASSPRTSGADGEGRTPCYRTRWPVKPWNAGKNLPATTPIFSKSASMTSASALPPGNFDGGRDVFRIVQLFGDECPGKPRPAPTLGDLIDRAGEALR